MPKFSEVPRLTRSSNYSVDIPWSYLIESYRIHTNEYGLDVNPDFQRGYCWTREQKIKYVEYVLMGGYSGKDLYFNSPSWNGSLKLGKDEYVLVDGKQRLE